MPEADTSSSTLSVHKIEKLKSGLKTKKAKNGSRARQEDTLAAHELAVSSPTCSFNPGYTVFRCNPGPEKAGLPQVSSPNGTRKINSKRLISELKGRKKCYFMKLKAAFHSNG